MSCLTMDEIENIWFEYYHNNYEKIDEAGKHIASLTRKLISANSAMRNDIRREIDTFRKKFNAETLPDSLRDSYAFVAYLMEGDAQYFSFSQMDLEKNVQLMSVDSSGFFTCLDAALIDLINRNPQIEDGEYFISLFGTRMFPDREIVGKNVLFIPTSRESALYSIDLTRTKEIYLRLIATKGDGEFYFTDTVYYSSDINLQDYFIESNDQNPKTVHGYSDMVKAVREDPLLTDVEKAKRIHGIYQRHRYKSSLSFGIEHLLQDKVEDVVYHS